MLDMDKVNKAVADGWISKRPHPQYPLFIYNYTPQCQYDWHWTTETIACRGLILDNKDNVVARPFPKFFTPDQYKDLRNKVHNLYGLRYKELYRGNFSVTEKVDGSMISISRWQGHTIVASRGSFMSEQAQHAQHIVDKKYMTYAFHPYSTYLFEIVYPENRIVVDYGEKDEIVLLTVLDNLTGDDLPCLVNRWRDDGHPIRAEFNFNTFDDIVERQEKEGEGYVVKFDNGLRVKVKFEEYVRLHKIITNVSARKIWEMLRDKDHESLDKLLELVPDEFYDWVRNVETKLREEYEKIKDDVRRVMYNDIVRDRTECGHALYPPLTRKQVAIKHQNYKYKGIMFQMLDNKDYAESIWKIIRPEAELPFAGISKGDTP